MKRILIATVLPLLASAWVFAAGHKEAARSDVSASRLYTLANGAKVSEKELVIPPVTRLAASESNIRQAMRKAPARPRRAEAAADAPAIAGAVIFADGWSETNKAFGLYNITPAASEMKISGVNASYGGVLKEDIFYAHNLADDGWGGFDVYIKGYDINSGEEVMDDWNFQAKYTGVDMTYDAVSGNVYGIMYADDNMESYVLAKLTYTTSTRFSKIYDLPGDWCAIAADKDGYLYAVKREIEMVGGTPTVTKSVLYMIVDPAEGLVSELGETGVLPYYQSSMAFDPATNRLYWNVCPADGSGSLYEIDTTTGKATLVYNLPNDEEIMGLYIPAVASTDVPAAPTDFTFSFEKGSLEGFVGFTAPSTLVSGAAGEGSLTYSLAVDGTPNVAAGTCSYGEVVSVPMTLSGSGNHEFAVSVSNGNGASQTLKESYYAGLATPQVPQNVVLVVDGDKASLSWTAVSAAATKGYFDAADVRYDVVRMPGSVTVAEGIANTEFSETLPPAEGYTVYSYSVIALNGTQKSAAGRSNSYSIGDIEPPYIEEFNDASSIGAFTIEGRWKYSTSQGNGYAYSASFMGIGNEWLITPAIKLQAGKTYQISFDAKPDMSSFPEQLEVKYGRSASSSAMTETLLESFSVNGKNFTTYTAMLKASETGFYYIGFCCQTDPDDGMALYIDNISVGAPIGGEIPAAPSSFTAYGDADGAMKVNISVTAPTLTYSGLALETIDHIDILRAGIVVHTFEAPAPGAVLTWTDESPAAGENEYTAIVYSDGEASQPAATIGFAGFDTPVSPTNFVVTEIADGIIHASWDAVTTGVHGGPINPALIAYDIATYDSVNMEIPVFGIKETEATFRAIDEGSQEYLQIILFATNGDMEAAPVLSEMIPVGTPHTAYSESFTAGLPAMPISIERQSNSTVKVFTDADGVPSQDGDNGIIGMQGTAVGATASFAAGKICIGEMVKPALSFWSYTIADTNTGHVSKNRVIVSIAEYGAEFKPVLSATVEELGAEPGWHKVNVPLDEYAGKTIIFKITAEVVNFQYTLFDNLRVGSSLAHDLALTSVSAPSHVKAGAPFSVSVHYNNSGAESAADYAVELYMDGELVASDNGVQLASGENGIFVFDVVMDVLAEETVAVDARINFDADENTANNKSALLEVEPIVSSFPAVTDLSAEETSDGSVVLTWSEPDYSGYIVPDNVEESFENAGAFAKTVEGWTFVDGDGLPTGSFKTLVFPGIEKGDRLSFFVMDSSSGSFGDYASGLSGMRGTKSIVALYAEEGENNDWAISPELSGEHQFVSFYARSYSSVYSERLEVLYTTGDAEDLASYVKLLAVEVVPHDWTAYEVELPEGATHFAVRYCQNDGMMLMLDNFSFSAKGTESLSLSGFNVYRDGARHNVATVEDYTYADGDKRDSESKYVVTAVYTQGESRASNAVTVGPSSGVENVADGTVKISADGCIITVTGAEGRAVKVVSADGKLMHASVAATTETIVLAPGVYIVSTGDTVAKFILR